MTDRDRHARPPHRSSHRSAHRTFIALTPSSTLRQRLVAARDRLADLLAAPPSDRRSATDAAAPVRWVAPASLHLTLAFLGDLSAPLRRAAACAVAEAAAETAPFDWGVRGWGGFPTRERARVLWVGVDPGAEAIVDLQARLVQRLRAHGVPVDVHRRFVPHLTLGRLRGRRATVQVPDRTDGPDGPASRGSAPTCRADRLQVLVRRPAPAGPRYRSVVTLPVGGGSDERRA
ncbi:MAG: RNA 2',3'-cyclic phosphodiesterase [Trueperaceae bacterium]